MMPRRRTPSAACAERVAEISKKTSLSDLIESSKPGVSMTRRLVPPILVSKAWDFSVPTRDQQSLFALSVSSSRLTRFQVMSNSDVHVGGQFLHEEALSRTRFAENEDHAPLDDDWQVAVFHSIVNCCNLRCFASPCRTISQGILLSNCTAKTPGGSTRRDQARRLAPRVHVASARLRAFHNSFASVLPGASASKKA